MAGQRLKIGVMAPGSPIENAVADRVKALARDLYGDGGPEILFHPQCFFSAGHFAGDDAARTAAFLDIANDESCHALWFARGGYGACRIAEDAIAGLSPAARDKLYLGYSDAGSLLAGMYKAGFATLAHGPMPADIARPGGDAAVARALAWLVDGASDSLEASVSAETRTAAFNISILSQILGTALQPDLTDHVIMLEDVSEYMYRIDRYLFHITGNPEIRRAAGIRLGRLTDIPENDRNFGASAEEVIAYWCARSDIAYLGRADIGHDIDNKIVPFGLPSLPGAG